MQPKWPLKVQQTKECVYGQEAVFLVVVVVVIVVLVVVGKSKISQPVIKWKWPKENCARAAARFYVCLLGQKNHKRSTVCCFLHCSLGCRTMVPDHKLCCAGNSLPRTKGGSHLPVPFTERTLPAAAEG